MAKQNASRRLKEAWAYFRATEEVSKPVAFLMLFFGFTFVISLLVGVFLLGRWGYQQITDSNQNTSISVPSTNDTGDSKAPEEPTTATDSPSSSTQGSGSVAVTPPKSTSVAQTNASSNLPNTGGLVNAFVIMLVFSASTLIHRRYVLKKLTT